MRIKGFDAALIFWVMILCFPSNGAQAAQNERLGSVSVMVAPVEVSAFQPPEESMVLLQKKLLWTLGQVGDFRFSEREEDADMVLQPSLLSWTLEEVSGLDFVVEMEISLDMEGKYRDRIILRAIGTGPTVYSAAVRAVDETVNQYLHHLPDTELRRAGAGIYDIVAGRAIINRGREKGIRRGMEFRSSGDFGELVILKVLEVYDTYSEGYIIAGADFPTVGTPMERLPRAGLKSSGFLRYVRFLYGEGDSGSQAGTWSTGVRTYLDRGLFSLNPFVGVDYLGEGISLAAAGTAMNWYSRRMVWVPAAGMYLGVSPSGGDGYFWGGFVEFGLRRQMGQRWLLQGDIGVSNLYYSGSGDEDMQFLYSGIGLMLKY